MPTQIQIRRDSGANWTSANPTLAQGELGLDLTNNKIKIGDGSTAWTSLPYFNEQETGGGGLSVSDFGEGFTDSLDSGKITTSKLYNENPNPGLNNQYELGVTNGGVVTLPDGSIINGATLKTIAGNYAGITAGPASPAGKDEDSWMWVDNNGATIATKYSTDAHTWTFNNSGALTFPQGTTIATADGTDAFIIDGAVDKDIQIYTYSGPTPTAHGWTFGTDGDLTLPAGGDILDSEGNSVLGGATGDANVWVQTFETQTGAPTDIVSIAISVEYDSAGNVIALFNHFNDDGGGSYYSVGKYTTTGAKIWTARFDDEFYTDGWGLAVDNDTDSIYVAGETDVEGQDNATLTKLDSTDGSVLWSKIYDFGFSSQSSVVDVASDGNPVMVGYAYNGTDDYVATTKVDEADGSVIWSRALDGQADEEAYGMAVGPTGEVVAIGYMEQLGVSDGVATLYADNNLNWTGGVLGATSNGVAFSVTVTAGVATFSNISDTIGNRSVDDVIATINGSVFGGVDGVDDMVVKVGTLATNDPDNRMLVVKYASDGTIAWQKAILFDAGFDCRGADADIDSMGNIYVTGSYQYSFDGGTTNALSILKLDGTGAKQWSRRVTGDCDTFGVSVVVGADDKLYLSAMTGNNNDANNAYTWVAAKYDFNGQVEWQRLIDKTTTGWTFTGGIFFSDGGGSNIAVKSGYVVLGGGFGDFIGGGTPQATLIQVAASGDVFSVSDWDFKAASFSGVLNGTASDITVVDAGKTDTDNSENITTGTVTLTTEVSGFLLGTLYSTTANNRLFNGGNELVLGTTGTVTLPQGGTITEGYVTSNPTIQLTPATPDVASQKLVIKGGSNYNFTDNGITLSYQDNTALVGDTLEFYINGASNYNNQTLYWWIYPTDAGLTTPSSGTIAINGTGGSVGPISFVVDNDDYEFTVRVSPEDNNYDPANVGVESGLINADAPTFDSPYHLHLTTGNLAETSIFLGTDNHNVRTTVDGGIQVTTETTVPLVPPTTIVISGADVALVNVTYIKDGANSLWYPVGYPGSYDPANDPFIQFVEGEYGIVAPGYDPVTPLYVNTGTLNVPVAQWNTNPPYGSVAPTGVYTYPTPDVHAWQFGTDGIVTLPNGMTIDSSGDLGSNAFVRIGGNNTRITIDDNGAPPGIVMATDITGTGNYWLFSSDGITSLPGDLELNPTGNIRGENGINIEVNLSDSTLRRWQFGEDGDLTFPDNTVQTTAYTGSTLTTVAKTGIAYNTGTATALEDSTYIGSIVDGNYGPFTLSGVTFTVVVTSGVAAYTVTATTGNTAVGAVIGTLDTGDLGGTSGSTSNISVADVVQGVTAIDLTKTINKLTDGAYTLADGTEGQIMYLVAQNGVVPANVSVLVANSRNIGVGTLSPFSVYDNSSESYYDSVGGICTLIFTDGAWQQSGGAWGTPT